MTDGGSSYPGAPDAGNPFTPVDLTAVAGRPARGDGQPPDALPGMTRRRMLWLAGAGATGLGLAGCGDPAPPTTAGLAFNLRSALPQPHPTPSITLTPRPPALPRTKPAFYLDQYATKPPANAVALTIDDGPSPVWTPRVLEVLRRFGVSASFCLIGQQVRQQPELVQEIVAAGHTVCNHTMSHPLKLARMSQNEVEHEIARASEEIFNATGVTPKAFRAPGGAWSRAIFAVAAKHDLIPIDWSIDPFDWKRPGTRAIRARLLQAKAGEILLCHDGGGERSETVAALTAVIPTLQRRGLRFVPL